MTMVCEFNYLDALTYALIFCVLLLLSPSMCINGKSTMFLCVYIEDISTGIMLSVMYSAIFVKLKPYLQELQ